MLWKVRALVVLCRAWPAQVLVELGPVWVVIDELVSYLPRADVLGAVCELVTSALDHWAGVEAQDLNLDFCNMLGRLVSKKSSPSSKEMDLVIARVLKRDVLPVVVGGGIGESGCAELVELLDSLAGCMRAVYCFTVRRPQLAKSYVPSTRSLPMEVFSLVGEADLNALPPTLLTSLVRLLFSVLSFTGNKKLSTRKVVEALASCEPRTVQALGPLLFSTCQGLLARADEDDQVLYVDLVLKVVLEASR